MRSYSGCVSSETTKAKIQAKKNDKKGALTTVKVANQWAKKKKNDNYIEQTSLFWKHLLTKK